ncbi:MAG: molybdopterin-guanine dinucleotide biosynthesis protein, partial [Alphaproteobacteria bacterium]
MTSHRIASVEPLHYPALRVTFVDGIAGILDFSDSITTGAIFAP